MDAAFELLRLSAARVTADVAVVEIEGRFRQGGRFTRQPRLVVEDAGARVQHAPVHAELAAGRWRGTFAVPADVLESATLALGVRGALLELPAPDVDERDRLAALARDTNALRRALESAETDAAAVETELRARVDEAEAVAVEARRSAAAELEQARAQAAEEQLALREEHAAELERARGEGAAEIERLREEHAAQAAAAAEQADARVAAAEERVAEAEQRLAAAEQRAAALEVDAAAARDAHADDRRRAEAAIAELQDSLERARADASAREAAVGKTEPGDKPDPATLERPADDDATQPLTIRPEARPKGGDDTTEAVPLVARAPAPAPRHGDASEGAPEGWVPMHRQPSPARWVAVAALLVFFVVLLVLLGFL